MRHLLKILPLALVYVAVVALIQRYGHRDLLFATVSLSVMAPVVYLVADRFVQKNNLLKMKESALRAELALLKSQINPHFFFNTLNNLYGLAAEKSDLAPKMILELADLMRFTIYEGKKDRVLLRDEIAYLEHYLAIQRIRLRERKATVRFERDVADDLVQVPPLLFVILVENAFKHGVASLTAGAYVHLRLEATRDAVAFRVENNFDPGEPKPRGIGIANLQRRLALLYPGRHRFETCAEEGVYRAELRIEL